MKAKEFTFHRGEVTTINILVNYFYRAVCMYISVL